MINTLCQSLADVCDRHLLEEKWVVCPGLRAGQQWLDRVARAGGNVFNAHPKTLRSMALDLAGPHIAREGVELAGPVALELITDSVWREIREELPDGYLTDLSPGTDLSRALQRTMSELRMADLAADDIDADGLEVPLKGTELRAMLESYDARLREDGFLDYAAALEIAIQAADECGLPGDVLVLIPRGTEDDCAPLERQFVEALPAGRVVVLDQDRPGVPLPDEAGRTDTTQLRWVRNPSDAPESPADGSVRMFPAVGAVNEVREVLRRCLEDDLKLDEVEVLYTDGETYVPLFYEEMQALLPGGVTFDEDPRGATFSDGIPIRYSRPGRALAAWLEWTADGFPQRALVRMIQDGLLRIPGRSDRDFTFAELSDLLRSVPIHEGRASYIPELDAHIRGLEQRIEERSGEEDDDRTEERRRAVAGLRLLRDITGKLIENAPPDNPSNADMLAATDAFLSEAIRRAGKLDDYARTFLQQRVREMSDLLERVGGESSMDAREWLEELVEEGSVGGVGPRPGCLHLAPVHAGGHSGRESTFIVGLDEGRFPPSGSQDPLLLDGERENISGDLATSNERLEEGWKGFTRVLSGLRGRLTLSYSCCDIKEGRDQFPSPALIAAYRVLSADTEGDQSDFLKWERLPDPVSFAGGEGRPALDEAEWWLGRLCRSAAATDRSPEVIECFPHLRRGQEAVENRESDRFTVYDGRVEEISEESSGTNVLSSSRLQTIGKCPLGYFFQRVLGIELPEEIKRDPDEWLDALDKGTLLHEVFRQFMAGLLDEDLLPDFERDWPRLEKVLDEEVERWTERKPPPRRDLLDAQRRELRDACRIFLASEEEFCRTSRPVYLESNVGMPADAESYALDAGEPVPLRLPGGAEARARGRIDRIDQVGEGDAPLYDIWDYKTGSSKRYEGSTFDSGRRVQHALYLALAEKCLREDVSPGARVRQFGYFFASGRGGGKRITFTPEELADGLEIVDGLRSIARSGAFSATTKKNDCRYCDFETICRDTEKVAEQSQKKVENEENELLDTFRELRNK